MVFTEALQLVKNRPYQRKERIAWVTGWSGLQGTPAAEDGRVWFDGRHGLQVTKVGFHGSPAVGEKPPLPEKRAVCPGWADRAVERV